MLLLVALVGVQRVEEGVDVVDGPAGLLQLVVLPVDQHVVQHLLQENYLLTTNWSGSGIIRWTFCPDGSVDVSSKKMHRPASTEPSDFSCAPLLHRFQGRYAAKRDIPRQSVGRGVLLKGPGTHIHF